MADSSRKTEPGPASVEPRRIRWADMTGRDYGRIGAGVFFCLLGVAGLMLPILQGVLFLLVSALLLAPYSLWVKKRLASFETKFPWLSEKARGIATRWGRKKPADE